MNPSFQRLRRWTALEGLAVAVVAALPFYPTLGHGFFLIDDDVYITKNPEVLGGLTWSNLTWAFTSGYGGQYQPLTWLSLQLDASLSGPEAFGFHLSNLALHAACAALLWALGRRLGLSRPWAWTVALVWAWHPLRVESVAWVTERKDVLSGVFALAACLAWKQSARSLAAGLAACAMLSKPMLVTLPFAFFCLDLWATPAPRWVDAARSWGRYLPVSVLAGGVAVLNLLAGRASGLLPPQPPLGERLLPLALRLGEYAWKSVGVSDLSVMYPLRPVEPAMAWAAWGALTVAVALLMARRERLGPLGPGLGWMLVSLLPVLGLVQAGYQRIADRFTYWPHVGLFLGLGLLLSRWRLPSAARVASFLPMLLAVATIRQVQRWEDPVALFEHSLRVEPEHNAFLRMGLVRHAFEKKDRQGVLDTAQEALNHGVDTAELHTLWALALEATPAVAEPHYRTALERGATAWTVHNYGVFLARLGRLEEAAAVVERGLQSFPRDASLAQLRALVAEDLGRKALPPAQ